VSKGGNLLLNLSPKADGTIPAEQQQILAEIGRWLDTNGDAIYESRPWNKFGEGDFRFTTRAGLVYAIGLKWPEGAAVIPALASRAGRISTATMLGGAKLEFLQTGEALTVRLPAAPAGPGPFVLRISGL
jgi:alpha-L-fucosidase